MNIITLNNNFRDALADDAPLTSWSNSVYGQVHKVYSNFNPEDPPVEDNCPYVVVFPLDKETGKNISKVDHVIRVGFCIFDETLVEGLSANIVEYNGVARIEAMRKLGETAVDGVDLGNAHLEEILIEYETIEDFPFFLCRMDITVREPKTIGSDPLL